MVWKYIIFQVNHVYILLVRSQICNQMQNYHRDLSQFHHGLEIYYCSKKVSTQSLNIFGVCTFVPTVGVVRLRILLLAVVSTIAISAIGWEAISVKATISVPSISLSLGLGISRPLAIVTTIAISAISWEAISIEATISVPSISLGLRLSISRPLAIVTTIAISAISREAIAVKATISVPSISLSLGLGISRPLAIVSAIAISAIGWETISVEAFITVPGISL